RPRRRTSPPPAAGCAREWRGGGRPRFAGLRPGRPGRPGRDGTRGPAPRATPPPAQPVVHELATLVLPDGVVDVVDAAGGGLVLETGKHEAADAGPLPLGVGGGRSLGATRA